MRRIYDFKCPQGHTSEHLVHYDVHEAQCPVCGETSHRLISAPNIMLEGWSMAFPTAADKWARKHEEGARIARERKLRNGEDA
jgi:putative FmdB family regulatory protein